MRSLFARWRAAAPEHDTAHDHIVAIEGLTRGLAGAPEILALREETLGRVRQGRSRVTPGWRMAGALAASVMLVLGISGWFSNETLRPLAATISRAPVAGERIHTAIGQRAEVTLADGSTVVLNTDSEVKVIIDEDWRRVELLRGQAWFQVVKDPARPFVVAAAGREITALGTAFDVRIDRGRLEVMLVEGRVRVARPEPVSGSAQTASAVTLEPQQMLIAESERLDVRNLADSAPIEGWRSGILIFDDQPLSDAVGEFNRYALRPMLVADAGTGAIRISGAFKIGDDRAFLGALSAGFGVEAEITDAAITLSRD